MATDDELLRQWAEQNGADYNVLTGNTGTNTNTGNTGSGNTNNDIYSEYGWDSGTLPGTNIPTTGTTTTTPTTTTTTPTTTNTTANAPGYDAELAAWAAANGADYNVLYYGKYGVYPSSFGTPTTPTNPTGDNTTPTTPGSTTPTTPGSADTTGTNTQTDAWAEWSAIMARVNAGTATIEDYYRAQQLASILSGGSGATGTGGVVTPGSGTTGGNIPGSNVTHNYPAVDMDNRQRINDMYDAQINAQRAALQEEGAQALSDAQANRDKIADLYNKQRNAASVDWERQRRNFLESANTSGINTGAGSQAELSMMSMYQRAQNDLGAAQAQAEAEADRNIADIKRSTQASINEAIAKNDYQKAAALLDEYNAEYNRAVERAEALGQYGDFSGYAALYGDEAAAQMRYTWIMSNPEIALAMGQITQQQYTQLVLYKQYPGLAMTGGTGYGGSNYSGDGTGTGDGSSSWAYGATYNMGELIDAAAAGMTREQIEAALTERGIDVTQPTVQADITTALSK